MSLSKGMKIDLGSDIAALLFVLLIIIGLWRGWFSVSFNINLPIAISILGLGSMGSLKSIISSMIKVFKI